MVTVGAPVTGAPATGADEWTHQRRGAEANPVSRDAGLAHVQQAPPDRLRWINDVTKIWPHAFRVAGGRVFFFRGEQEHSDGRVIANTPMAARVRCRSAYNGVLLWDKSFPDVAPHNSMNRPVAPATRVYLHNKFILAVDAATGKEVGKSDLAPFRPPGEREVEAGDGLDEERQAQCGQAEDEKGAREDHGPGPTRQSARRSGGGRSRRHLT